MKIRHMQFEIKPSDALLWMNIMTETLDEILGEEFLNDKAEILRSLSDQATDLVTTEENGNRIYGPMDRISYQRNQRVEVQLA